MRFYRVNYQPEHSTQWRPSWWGDPAPRGARGQDGVLPKLTLTQAKVGITEARRDCPRTKFRIVHFGGPSPACTDCGEPITHGNRTYCRNCHLEQV